MTRTILLFTFALVAFVGTSISLPSAAFAQEKAIWELAEGRRLPDDSNSQFLVINSRTSLLYRVCAHRANSYDVTLSSCPVDKCANVQLYLQLYAGTCRDVYGDNIVVSRPKGAKGTLSGTYMLLSPTK